MDEENLKKEIMKDVEKYINDYMKKYEDKVYYRSIQYAARNVSVTEEGLFGAIDKLIDRKIKDTKFNYNESGRIAKDNGNGTYEIKANGGVQVLDSVTKQFVMKETYTVSATEGAQYNVGDIVYIEIVNNIHGSRYIKCKRPKTL